MSIKRIFCVLSFLGSANASALSIDHCPTPDIIKKHQGVYFAPTVSRQGQWIGMVSDPGQADEFAAGDHAITFEGAVFVATERNGTNKGLLLRCMYVNEDGKKMDLYYRPEVRPQMAVQLLDRSNWKKQKTSVSGLTTYLCTNPQKGGCVFAEVE